MSALKFDVLDMIREPDNYTSAERAQAAEAVASVLEMARSLLHTRDEFRGWSKANPGAPAPRPHLQRMGDAYDRLHAALARFGGAE